MQVEDEQERLRMVILLGFEHTRNGDYLAPVRKLLEASKDVGNIKALIRCAEVPVTRMLPQTRTCTPLQLSGVGCGYFSAWALIYRLL